MELRYYQKQIIKKIKKNNIIVLDLPTGAGVDFMLKQYILDNFKMKACYIGHRMIYQESYQNIDYCNYQNLQSIYGKKYDLIIIELLNDRMNKYISEICHMSQKTIIKNNLYQIKNPIDIYIDINDIKTQNEVRKLKIEEILKQLI